MRTLAVCWALLSGCATSQTVASQVPVLSLTLERNYVLSTECTAKGEVSTRELTPEQLQGNVILDYGSATSTQSAQYVVFTQEERTNLRAFDCPEPVLLRLGVTL
ncbi:MAG: hypothetical protein AAFQ82_04135 [Myxococcota bacterium]